MTEAPARLSGALSDRYQIEREIGAVPVPRPETQPIVVVSALFDASDYEAAAPHSNYDVGPDGRFVMVHQGRLSEMIVIQNWPEEVRRKGSAGK